MRGVMMAAALVLALAATPALAQSGEAGGIKRTDTPNFPISQAVLVPGGSDLFFFSGVVPSVTDPAAPKGSIQSFGDTEAQTENVLGKIRKTMEAQGLGLKDVVLMHVYLVGDPAKGGTMDFAGMMNAYRRHFGTAEQPNKPARSTVQVAGLASAGMLVEIEVVAARAKP
jgi:enamine deaminase RidA (YjgF/YER057c/UK114 family)